MKLYSPDITKPTEVNYYWHEKVLVEPMPKPKQGEWIVDILNYKSVCPVCGADETAFIYGTEMWYGLGESRFCPSCGARMKGADDE